MDWRLEGYPPILTIFGERNVPLTVEYRARLDWRDYRWTVGPFHTDARGYLDVEVNIPPEASDSTNPIDPEDLADLYVDMCPRGWSEEDDEWLMDGAENNPYLRLELAAAEQPAIEDQVVDAIFKYLLH